MRVVHAAALTAAVLLLTFTRNDLVDRITGGEAIVLDRNVDVHVSAIRKKLGDRAELITTVRGVGYKCKDS